MKRKANSAIEEHRLITGFTLVEVLLATFILTLIMTVGYGSLSYIIKGKALLDDRRDAMLIGDAILSRFTRELQLVSLDERRAIISRPNEDEKTSSTALLGQASNLDNGLPGDSITFLAMDGGQYLPDGGTHTGVVQITYRVASDPEQRGTSDKTYYLIRDEIPYLRPPEKAWQQVMTFPVTAQLVSMSFEYYDADKAQWTNTWTGEGTQKVPAMVRFSISIKSPAGKINTWSTAVYLRASQ